jgi:hypothetical protein
MKALERESERVWFRNAQAYYVLGMAQSRMKQSAQARLSVAKGNAWLKPTADDFARNGVRGNWHDWLICQFLKREGERTLETVLQSNPQATRLDAQGRERISVRGLRSGSFLFFCGFRPHTG